MELAEDLAGLVVRLRGYRLVDQAAKDWPTIKGRLDGILHRVRGDRYRARGMPDVDVAADWLYRTVHEQPFTGDAAGPMQADVAGFVVELHRLLGGERREWKPAPPPEQRPPHRAPA